MNINDPLRVGAEGVKHDYVPKLNGGQRKHPDTKRYYPLNKKGEVDEWAAIANSQISAANHQAQAAKLQKRNVQDSYMAELRALNEQKYQEQQKEYSLKVDEREIADSNAKTMADQQNELNKQDKSFRKAMGKAYIREMADRQRKRIEDKLKSINEDHANLPDLEKVEAEERLKQKMAQMQLKNDQENLIKQRSLMKANLREQENKAYKEMIQKNAEKEVQNEKEYKNIFSLYENKHKSRVQHHENYLKTHGTSRKPNWEGNCSITELIQQRKDDNGKFDEKKNFDFVKEQIERKQKQRARDGEYLRKSVERRFQQEEFNQKLEKLEKEQAIENQSMYKDLLNKQIKLMEGKNYGTMTQVEKRMNRSDLHGYKHGDHNVNCLIPGINHSHNVGSKALYKKKRNFSQKPEGSLTDRSHAASSNGELPPLSKPISRNTFSNHKRNSYSLNPRPNHHNPITNPLNQYNPYLSDAKMKVVNDHKPFLR
ncbi:unnamed protein product [Moneuplotes crassus]|uniref:Uncharacterized protein n=1 Tax=Euplotes crassus TaxID=5936 RepID=A0AAD1UMD6_EUPCR|nr:unnamed protein product [Moneuplotes crassus]